MKWLCDSIFEHTAEEYGLIYEAMTDSRRERVDRLKKENDRLRSLVGELLVKKAVAEEFGIENAELYSLPNGRPMLKNNGIYVSISHCDERVACAVASEPVGIDTERLVPRDMSLAQRICTDEELVYLFGKMPTEKDYLSKNRELTERFYEIWTAKEAYFKKRGTGITDFKSVNIMTLKRQMFYVGEYLIQIV